MHLQKRDNDNDNDNPSFHGYQSRLHLEKKECLFYLIIFRFSHLFCLLIKSNVIPKTVMLDARQKQRVSFPWCVISCFQRWRGNILLVLNCDILFLYIIFGPHFNDACCIYLLNNDKPCDFTDFPILGDI